MMLYVSLLQCKIHVFCSDYDVVMHRAFRYCLTTCRFAQIVANFWVVAMFIDLSLDATDDDQEYGFWITLAVTLTQAVAVTIVMFPIKYVACFDAELKPIVLSHHHSLSPRLILPAMIQAIHSFSTSTYKRKSFLAEYGLRACFPVRKGRKSRSRVLKSPKHDLKHKKGLIDNTFRSWGEAKREHSLGDLRIAIGDASGATPKHARRHRRLVRAESQFVAERTLTFIGG